MSQSPTRSNWPVRHTEQKFWAGCRTADILIHLQSNKQPEVCKPCCF